MVTKALFLVKKTGKRKDVPWDNGWMREDGLDSDHHIKRIQGKKARNQELWADRLWFFVRFGLGSCNAVYGTQSFVVAWHVLFQWAQDSFYSPYTCHIACSIYCRHILIMKSKQKNPYLLWFMWPQQCYMVVMCPGIVPRIQRPKETMPLPLKAEGEGTRAQKEADVDLHQRGVGRAIWPLPALASRSSYLWDA